MNMKDLLRRFREADAPDSRWRRLSKLLLNTTWSFFIAIVVFIVASYILLPHFLHQESELKRLRQEIDALNEALKTVMDTITAAITGEEPSGCTHDCSTCGGCH